jgi:hypothetical protein
MGKNWENRHRGQPASRPRPASKSSWMRVYRWTILRTLPLGVFLPMTIFFGSVGPDDFAKNYAAWARKWGLTDWADWLSQYATGPRVFWTVALISLVYLAIAFAIPYLIKRAKKNTAIVAVPISVAVIVAVAVFGQYEISIPSERHITELQRSRLKEILGPVAPNFPRALSVAAADNPESNGYAIELMIALGQAGLKIASLNENMLVPAPMRALAPNVRGAFFQVHDPENPPQEAKDISKALTAAGITTNIYNNQNFPDMDYALTVGLK